MAYDADKGFLVCQFLESQADDCQSLRQCCEKAEVAPSTFLGWCDDHQELAEQYARADKIATDIQFERFAELNDEKPPAVEGRVDAGWVQWQRMRLENRKWAMSKRSPSKYGDKIAVGGDPGNPVKHKIDGGELIERILGVSDRDTTQPDS